MLRLPPGTIPAMSLFVILSLHGKLTGKETSNYSSITKAWGLRAL